MDCQSVRIPYVLLATENQKNRIAFHLNGNRWTSMNIIINSAIVWFFNFHADFFSTRAMPTILLFSKLCTIEAEIDEINVWHL